MTNEERIEFARKHHSGQVGFLIDEIDRMRDWQSAYLKKQIEVVELWTGINQAMTLLARDDLLDTDGYRRLQALLKDEVTWQTNHLSL